LARDRIGQIRSKAKPATEPRADPDVSEPDEPAEDSLPPGLPWAWPNADEPWRWPNSELPWACPKSEDPGPPAEDSDPKGKEPPEELDDAEPDSDAPRAIPLVSDRATRTAGGA
jgi:hypothetical protein